MTKRHKRSFISGISSEIKSVRRAKTRVRVTEGGIMVGNLIKEQVIVTSTLIMALESTSFDC